MNSVIMLGFHHQLIFPALQLYPDVYCCGGWWLVVACMTDAALSSRQERTRAAMEEADMEARRKVRY